MDDALLPWLAVAAAAVATYLSRGLGVLAGGRINPSGPLFEWVSCVAYALLAGLVSRMIFLPLGPLAETSLATRLAAVVVAVAAFYLTRRNLMAGVVAGLLALGILSAGVPAWSF